jgi:WD40 repeat protein
VNVVDGRTLAITADWFFGFWDARTGKKLHRSRISTKGLWGSRISADGRWVALTGIDHPVRIWNARNFKQVDSRRFDLLPRDLSIRPDGKLVVDPVEFGVAAAKWRS